MENCNNINYNKQTSLMSGIEFLLGNEFGFYYFFMNVEVVLYK